MAASALVAVEAQLASAAHRHLQVSFGRSVLTTRGDGWVLFQLPAAQHRADEDAESSFAAEMQRLISALAREVTNHTSLTLSGEAEASNFSTIADRALNFSTLIARYSELGSLPADYAALPNTATIQQMLELLYKEVAADLSTGVHAITNFPAVLCPTGTRFDVVVKKAVCVRAYSSTTVDLRPGRDRAESATPAVSPRKRQLQKQRDELAMEDSSLLVSVASLDRKMLDGPMLKVWINTHELAQALSTFSTASLESELPPQWRSKTFSLAEGAEVLRLVHTSLMEYWASKPHTERTRTNCISLLSIVSGDLREYIRSQVLLQSSDWRGPWRMALADLQAALHLCRKWKKMLNLLQRRDWQEWESGEAFQDESFLLFSQRLQDAVRIRETLQSITQLHEKIPDSLVPEIIFEDANMMDLSSPTWDTCVAAFEKELSFLTPSLRNRVKQLFTGPPGDSQLRVVEQYTTLLRREDIGSAVGKELDAVAEYLVQKLATVASRYENNVRRATTDLQRLRASKTCQAEGSYVPEVAYQLFGPDSERTTLVAKRAEGIIVAAQKEEVSVMEQWRNTVEAQCKKIKEVEEAAVIQTIDGERLTCTVHQSIQQFLQEVRNIRCWISGASSYSANPSRKDMSKLSDGAENTIKACELLVAAAIRMQQTVANFNTVLHQIIPCTRPMLDPAVKKALSHILFADTPRRTISLGNYQELEGLILSFQNTVESLSADNRHIRRFHGDFISQVLALHNVDLTKHMDQWRSAVDGMRSSFEDFLTQHNFANYDRWRRHWDAQIFKALEYQYRKGLESLHENMEELKVELVFKQGVVQFKPTFEAMREAYYVKVREFVSVPLRFRGLQPKREGNGTYELYPLMPVLNNERIITVHTKAIELFTKLNRVRKAFRQHIVIGLCGMNGSPDLDSIVEQWANTDEQFGRGFEVVKEHLAKMQKIEDVMKVDCFSISTVPVKASMEEQLHRLEESLLNALRKRMQVAVNAVDEFIFNASNVVERQPTTMDEVGKANQAYHEYLGQLGDFEKQLEQIDINNKDLRARSGAAIDLSATKTRWEHLRDAMSSHTKVIEASVSKMRVSLDSIIQKFLKDIQRFANNWSKQKNLLLDAFRDKKPEAVQRLLVVMKDLVNDLHDLEKQATELESKCAYFNQPKPNFTVLASTVKDVTSTSAMWSLYDQFEEKLGELRREDWLTFRSHTYQFDDFCKEWNQTLAQRTSEGGDGNASENIIATYLLNMLIEWNAVLPLLKFCRGDGWMTEHWNELFRLLEIPKGMTSAELTFGDVLEHYTQLLEKQAEVKQLHSRAQGEIQIREALQDLRTWALEANFTLVAPNDGAGKIKLISEWKDVMTQVSENQALVGSLKDSPFYANFADEAAGWESKLIALSESLILLNSIQRRWAYLEPIFARGALPQEQARFKRVDKEFVSILREVEADPRVMSLAAQIDLADKLKGILEQIERCQKSLMEYLDTKRDKLPRFYFISDEDLLEILGHSQNPSVIQSHLKKLFMGIHSVEFNEDKTAITHMLSADHERVQLLRPVNITGPNVEDWLIQLDEVMKATLQELIVKCVGVKDPTSMECVRIYPSQVLQVAQQILATSMIHDSISRNTLKEVHGILNNQLSHLTSASASEDEVTKLKIKALILDVIHNVEVVELLMAKQVRDPREWWWQKQLRYTLDDKQLCHIRMIDTTFAYTYEYQGNAAKLVHTPLTDKCYLVLTKGMGLGYGGNPYGPAGTGKTESVKALGSAMGRQVLVFNCDEGIDFKAMGRIFVGIVKCGAWGCFDEFNRLKIDQLSAISQMIQVIQEALKNKEPTCPLLNKAVDLNPNAGIFVTLNPAGKGYGGRTKLPDNLKQLFREVAMSVPDNELITSTMLLSEGFVHAKKLATNVVQLYKLCGQLMSTQQHYDWGLRPLKAVLRLGGSLVQRWKANAPGKTATEMEEAELMIQSLNINTISKLTFDDARLFRGLIRDIFPGAKTTEISYVELEDAVKKAIHELGLQEIPAQVLKVLQLYEAMNQRTGVVLVGPSGSGKSTLINILRKALEMMKIAVPLHVMNPKAMPRRQLLGFMDPDTREWYDGVLTAAARDVVKQPKESRPWILCDGDIDPEWIESLNSVLDDNKLLTMPNGVRIQFGANVNFVFETHSLEYASPATVSRMGVLFFSDKDIYLESVVESVMAAQSERVRTNIQPLILKHVFAAIDEVLRLNTFSVPTTRMGLLQTCLNHVMQVKNEGDFIHSMVRGLGGTMTPEGAVTFANAIYAAAPQKPLNESRPLDTYYDAKAKKMAEFSSDLTATITPAELLAGHAPMIKTAEIQRLLATLAPLARDKSCKPVFLVGPEGCGKGKLLKHSLKTEEGVGITIINCSAQTSSVNVVQKLEQLCTLYSTNTGRVFRPKDGERLVLIFRNINLPKPDRYGTVELHSFIHQLLMYQGFYNKELEFIRVERIQIMASMNPATSAGRYPVTPRLLAIVNIITMAYPSKSSLLQIYTTYWAGLLRSTNIGQGKDYDGGRELAQFMITVYDKIRRRFEGEDYAHFLICPRHLTSWLCNVLLYQVDALTSLPAVLANEAYRIFSDCLPHPEDRSKADKIFTEHLAAIGFSAPSRSERYAMMFVSWFRPLTANEGEPRLLEQKKYEDIAQEVQGALLRYSREFKELDITVIAEVISWIARVDRVLARPGGHLILVGRPGVGRRDATILAAYMQRMEFVTLNMTHDYSIKNFRNDLRTFIQRATTQNTRMLLVLEDHNIIDESFLEYINGLVSSGEAPGLFTSEEMENMYSSIREEAANDGYIGNIYGYFVDRLQKNFRVALIMDNQHELFLVRLQSNPGLLTKCELLWMGMWSDDVAKTVCKTRLKDKIAALESSDGNKGFHLHREMLAIHHGMGPRYSPKDFQVLMDSYDKIIDGKSKSSDENIERLEAGLAKLMEAESSVEKIKRDVAKKKGDCETMQKEADEALNKIQKSMEDSQEQRDQAKELQQQLKEEHEDIVQKRHKSEEELKDIKPMLDTAKDAVSSIQSEQLNEIRSLKSPPEPIRDVLEGVMALLGVTDVSWQSMRKFLGERGMKDRILDFKVDTITPAIRSSVSKLVQQKATSFKHEVIFHASKAAAPMAQWVTAMIKYADITERIAPLTRQLEQLERNQREGEEKLKALNKKLKEIDELVATLREEFTKKCKEAEKLRAKLEAAEKELHCAHELLGKLSGEKTRWAQEAETIREAKRTVPKRALIAAAFMTYLGRETEDVRLKYVSQWSERLGFTSPVDVTDFMSTEGERLQYKAEGLPGDQLSMENAVVLLGTVQTPLVIDPANQAIEWCKAHLRASNVVVEVASLHDERFAHTLELAIRFGKTLLVTEVSAIEALLFPVLRRDLTSAGAKRVVQVGNKSVDWQDTFRTILFTRSTDLSLPPGAAALVSEVNFSVTSFGLESQLLGLTIKNEKPELEQQKVELLRKEEGLKLDLSKLEVRLLSELANAHGDILENTQLVESLNEVKMQSTSIQEALSLSQVLQTELDEKRDVYRPFARQGSVLYFLIKDLARLNRMYQFGLADFIDLFTATLKGYHGAQELQVKIPELIGSFARAAFHRVCQGLFKQDRMIFGLHLLHGFHPEEYPAEAWDCLMGAVANVKSVEEVSLPAWAPPSSKVKFAALLATPTGAAAVEKWRLDNLDKWTKWMSSSSPEQHLASKGSFTTMEQLLLINTFRPDRMPALTLRIILESLKVDSLIPPTTMEELLKSSSASTPLLLITSSGADPSMEVQAVANHVVGKQRFTQMALGGGQTDEAMQQLRRCAAQGEWLFLKNLHLVLDWAHTLEKELCAMPEPNPGFRLIITTEAHDLFPSVLLRISTKVTVEAPPGVKQNLLRTYGSWDQTFLESMPQNGAQMLFGLAFFHSIVQERRTFVPQGWVQYYEFSPADLKAASDVLIDLSRKKSVDWVTLKGILENCIYGGRLDNPRDERVLQQLMDLYFTEEVIIRTSSPLYGNIMVPATGNRAAILPVIQQQIADVDVPAIFNLPPNADRAVLESAAGAQVEALRGLTKHTTTHQGSLEGWHKLLAPALELWKASDLKVGGPPRSIASNVADPDPIDVFFVSEVNLLAQLIIQLTAWFDDLRSMSEGTMIPSAEMRDEALELIGGRMPSRWLDRMDGPKESKLWLSLLARKYQTTLKWMKEPMSASIVYDLSSFLRPQTFFNALRQYTARQSKAPLVDLMLVASIGSSGIANSLQVSVSVKATSIVIQGAIIAPDGKVQRVSASSPSSVPLSTNIVVGWMSGDRAASKMSGYTTIPVYSNAERQTVVFPLCVPCASPSEELELSLNGVACFLVPS